MKMTMGELFECWDSVPEMAGDIGVGHWQAIKWWQRKRIPSEHWDAVIAAANRKGKKLSADDLLAMHRRKSRAQVSRASA